MMNSRRKLCLALAASSLVQPLASFAQAQGSVRRIGYLSAPTRASVEGVVAAFLRALDERGWVDGKNLAIEYRWAEGDANRLPALANELVRQKVELIVAPAAAAARAAKKATETIPIVMMF